ncbi:IS1634 family transposase [Mariniphaga sp.]|uniref:IS1634 family transposase n=1 Tax=Mariniphaga sp. TaxID=1954475 RepID=UPI00356ACE60
MYVRELKNRSGSISIQIISKARGRYKVVKSLGSAITRQKIERLRRLAQQEIERLSEPLTLFSSPDDVLVEKVFESLDNSSIQTVGPELVFGKIFDYIGFNQVGEELFRHLVVSRLAFPLSKLKTIEYLYRYQGVTLDIDAVYRFLDKLNTKLKEQVEQIAFTHTKKVLEGNISVVFYDMTTLYFEASDEDDLRKTGFSKDGKHQNPQIFIGLLVGLGGYAIGYDIFEGNSYEGHTLIPFLEKMKQRFKLGKLVVIADSGLLSNDNIAALEANGYEYILGARLKNESGKIKTEILQHTFSDGDTTSITKDEKTRLIVNYSMARATKDEYNRKRGLTRLEKQVKAGKLTKSNINNRGYNKYLKLSGEVSIEIDYEKYNQDKVWDGLKGYVTNTRLTDAAVMENYKNLWHIEKAFRMSKTDLRIRPIYHRLRNRIEAHLCIAFTAYCVYKELERILYHEKSTLSLKKAAELTHNMYQVKYTLPDSRYTKTRLLNMDDQQKELFDIVSKNF